MFLLKEILDWDKKGKNLQAKDHPCPRYYFFYFTSNHMQHLVLQRAIFLLQEHTIIGIEIQCLMHSCFKRIRMKQEINIKYNYKNGWLCWLNCIQSGDWSFECKPSEPLVINSLGKCVKTNSHICEGDSLVKDPYIDFWWNLVDWFDKLTCSNKWWSLLIFVVQCQNSFVSYK